MPRRTFHGGDNYGLGIEWLRLDGFGHSFLFAVDERLSLSNEQSHTAARNSDRAFVHDNYWIQ